MVRKMSDEDSMPTYT